MELSSATPSLTSTHEFRDQSLQAVVGVDVQSVDDVVLSLSHFGDRYLQRIFSLEEIEYARVHPATRAPYLAGRFAAREAVVKVLRLDDAPPPWSDIEITGVQRPRARLTSVALDAAATLGITEILLSIDYGRTHATAVAIADATAINNGRAGD